MASKPVFDPSQAYSDKPVFDPKAAYSTEAPKFDPNQAYTEEGQDNGPASTAVPFQDGEDGPLPAYDNSLSGQFSKNLEKAQGDRPGLDDDIDFGPQFIKGTSIPNPSPARILGNAIQWGTRGVEALSAGTETALENLGPLGEALGALWESSPEGGLSHGIEMPRFRTPKRDPLDPEIRAQMNKEAGDVFSKVSADPKATPELIRKTMDEWASKNGMTPFGPELDQAISLHKEAKDFTAAKAAQPMSDLEKEAQNFKSKPEPKVEDLFPTEESVAANEAAMTSKLEAEAKAFKDKKAETAEVAPVEGSKPVDVEHVNGLVDHVNDVTKDWKDAPSVEIHHNFDDLKDVDNDAIGVTTPEGKVLLNASAIDSPEVATAAVYHEALGHTGMSKVFGNALDSTLTRFYNHSKDFRVSVDKWMEDNPNAYETNSVARAADEVLAEMSEQGIIQPALMDRIKNVVKAIGRKAGMKLQYSDREIETILGMAHDAVINGKTVAENAFGLPRFMKKRKAFLDPNKAETQNDVSDILDFTASNLEKDEKITYSIPELERMADDLGLNGKKYVNQKGLTEEKLSARLLAANKLFTTQSDELAALAKKYKTDPTASVYAEIRQKLALQQAIAARLDGDTAEAGRALRVLREVSKSKQSIKAQARYMAEHGSEDVLSNPEVLQEFLDKYVRLGENEGSVSSKVKLLRDTTKKSNLVADVLNIPRTLRSSFDLSAPLRQGLFLVGNKEFYKALPEMMKYLASEKAYKALSEDIAQRPNYQLMLKTRLSLTGNVGNLAQREEAFMSRLVGDLPGVKQSERAYSGFLNKLRADVFDSMVKESTKAGIKMYDDPKVLKDGSYSKSRVPSQAAKDITNFINNATGRGNLHGFEGSAQALANTFFAPRLTVGRVNMLSYPLRPVARMLNPEKYTKLNPVVRKQLLRSYLAVGGLALTTMSLAKMGGADVEGNPTSSDYGKIKFGNTRYGTDLSPYVVLAARLATNKTTTLKGVTHELGAKYGDADAWDILTRFGRQKLAPIPSTVVDVRTGKNVVGDKVTPGSALRNLFVPMISQDLYEVYKDQDGDLAKTAAMGAPAIFGANMQTFDANKPRGDDK